MSRPVNKIIASAILVFCMFVSIACAQALPGAEDISAQANAAEHTFEEFMRESIQPRLAYEYRDCFFSEKDRVELSELSQQASFDLKKIYDAQEELRRRIEDYEGHRWDELYGQTGLWRKVYADGAKTLLFNGQVDYFVAFTAGPKKKERIVQDIISMCESGGSAFAGASGELLKARVIALMARDNESYKEQAESALDSILAGRNLPDEVYFMSAILKMKLSNQVGKEQLDRLAGRMEQSRCRDDFELNLELAFLALRLGQTDLLKEVIEKWPEAEDFVGSVILSEMEYQRAMGRQTEQTLRQKSVFEVTLAVKAARPWAEQHLELLEIICGISKFQSPLTFYVTAQAYAGSSPAAAVEYYLRAATAQQKQKSDELGIEAVQIAKQAADFGYRLYYEDASYRNIARQAVGYYIEIAGREADERVQYLYAGLLNDDGRSKEAIELLWKIAQSAGEFSKQAELDLIVDGLEDSSNDSELRYKLTSRLKNLVDSVGGTSVQDGMVRAEATELYCQLILENDDEASAQKVLTMLERTEGLDVQRSGVLRAGALKRLGRLPDAVTELLVTAKSDSCGCAEQGMEVLRAVLDSRIDECAESMADFGEYIYNCDRLAQYCMGCGRAEGMGPAELIRAEIAVLAAGDDKEKLGEAEQILIKLAKRGYDNDIDWLRCKARLLKAKGRFADAARTWGRICTALRTTGASQRQSRQWWRAKFYEIQCWAKLPDTTKADVAHAVEVLASSFRDIPTFWAAKLEELKSRANQ
jgi:hypothetical protein